MSRTRTTSPRVVVVGGGYGGRAVAKALDGDLDVTLVTERDQFLHNVPALRAVAVDGYADKLLIGYDRLLRRGRVVHARVDAVTDAPDLAEVTLEDGSRIEAEYVVVATGSSYPFPGKPAERAGTEILARYRRVRSAVDAATGVVVLGAGPVGLELAGELSAARPGLEVTVVDPGPVLLPGPYKDELRRRLADTLARAGVQVLLGDAVDDLPPRGPEGQLPPGTTITTRSGRRLVADLVFTAYGAQPNNQALTPLADALDEHGRLRVDAHLRVVGHPRLLAIGDITDVDEPKQAVVAEGQAKLAAATVRALVAGRPPSRAYKVSRTHPVVVPLGPRQGAAQLPVGSGVVVGRRLTRAIKGGTLFVPRYQKLLGHP